MLLCANMDMGQRSEVDMICIFQMIQRAQMLDIVTLAIVIIQMESANQAVSRLTLISQGLQVDIIQDMLNGKSSNSNFDLG